MPKFNSLHEYHQFRNKVIQKNRYVWDEDVQKFLDCLISSSKDRIKLIDKNTSLWRAQIGNCWRDLGNDAQIEVAFPAERMKPTAEFALDGRANAKGIPHLYLANNIRTAISEVRPWIGSLVSVAHFKLNRKLNIVLFQPPSDIRPYFFVEPNENEILQLVWSDVDRAFSQPVSRNEDVLNYVPTQIIAEHFKKNEFDGVAYSSKFNDGYNIVLFDLSAADVDYVDLHRVEKIEVCHSVQVDGRRYARQQKR